MVAREAGRSIWASPLLLIPMRVSDILLEKPVELPEFAQFDGLRVRRGLPRLHEVLETRERGVLGCIDFVDAAPEYEIASGDDFETAMALPFDLEDEAVLPDQANEMKSIRGLGTISSSTTRQERYRKCGSRLLFPGDQMRSSACH